MVKQVVSDSLRAQKREDKTDVSVIIFGIPESDNDVTIVKKLLGDDDVIDSIVSIIRGKQHASERKNAKVRLIIVELKRSSDREWVLHNARRLTRGSRTRIAKYLSSTELDDLKNHCVECHRWNESAA